jgi:cytochrome c oxidase subunit 2
VKKNMKTETRWGLTIVAAVLVGLALAALYAGLLAVGGNRFGSNGERIYFTATSNSGQSIVAEMGGMVMANPMMACADCHGPDGQGGTVQMMTRAPARSAGVGSFEAPDIRYKTLATAEHEAGHEEHPPYNDQLIRRAITQGLNPAGEPLNFPMPRWQMSESDIEDLLDYLKSLK